MNRNRVYSSRQNKTPVWVHTALALLIILFLFVVAVTIFRNGSGASDDEQILTSDDIVDRVTQEVSVIQTETLGETSRGIPDETTLLDASGGQASAVAKRIFENGFFTHTILANGLPAIDANLYHYQAWLECSYPFDFFATSRLVLNADGSWGMIWMGQRGETYDDFVEVLVTLEPNDDFDENPSSKHVLKGNF
jgi:hypothetical protein